MTEICLYLFILLSPLNSFNYPDSNEINGKFLYEIDIAKNELYIVNDKLELNTLSLKNGELLSTLKLSPPKASEVDNQFWKGLYRGYFSLNPSVISGLMGELKFKKFKNNGFKLFHSGGGLIIDISTKFNSINRLDNSFPFMNKFSGSFIEFGNDIYNFGGYGLFRTNNTMLKFDQGNSNQWDEVSYSNKIPNELMLGLAHFYSLLIDENYYILGGVSENNKIRKSNNSILKFNFKEYSWHNLGEISIDLSNNPLIIPSESCYYIFDKDYFYQVQIKKEKILRFEYQIGFKNHSLSQYNFNDREAYTFISHFHKGAEFSDEHSDEMCSNKFVHKFKNHDSKSSTKILNKYKLNEIINLNSKAEIPLLKVEQSRNQFFFPLLILLSIIIINILYKGLKKEKILKPIKLYSFKNNELVFLNTEIKIDNNTLVILKMLSDNDTVTSNDIVARLVEKGLSYDYASKVKNKIIESLNEKFEFITNSNDQFIKISKSSQDKRIQILSIMKD